MKYFCKTTFYFFYIAWCAWIVEIRRYETSCLKSMFFLVSILNIYLSICLFIYLSIYQAIYLSIYLYRDLWFEHSVSLLRVCFSAEGAKNVSSPWLSLLRGWSSLIMTFLGTFVCIYIYIYIYIYMYVCI